MSKEQFGKLFLLAMSTSSDAEALAALLKMKKGLKETGVDAYWIAEAINRSLDNWNGARYESDVALDFGSHEAFNQAWKTSRDERYGARTSNAEWHAAFEAPETFLMSESGFQEPVREQWCGNAQEHQWHTDSQWEEDDDSHADTERVVENRIAKTVQEEPKE